MTGRPTNTARAPRARALRASVPSLTPPSIYTSTPVPRTASTISGNTSICQNSFKGLLVQAVMACQREQPDNPVLFVSDYLRNN